MLAQHNYELNTQKNICTTANEGTRGSLVRMTPDVVYYSWAGTDMNLKVSESIWILLKERTLTLD